MLTRGDLCCGHPVITMPSARDGVNALGHPATAGRGDARQRQHLHCVRRKCSPNDCHTRLSRDVTDNIVQLDVHQMECLLHVLDMRSDSGSGSHAVGHKPARQRSLLGAEITLLTARKSAIVGSTDNLDSHFCVQ